MPDDFIAAKPSPLVRGFFQGSLPVILPRLLGIVAVDYEPDDLARLRALAPHRVLLTPNHPTNTEPALLFHLSCAVGQPFFFLACREAFEPMGGLWGQVIRRVGAFSVVRGTPDRASFRATRELLARPGAKMVIFPEGEVYSQNDTLLPFHSGVLQLAFWALEDVRRSGGDSSGGAADDPLYVLPVAIKYRFTQDMRPALLASLARLERFNGLDAVDAGDDPYRRLRRVCMAMLRSIEREYRLPSPKEDDLDANLTPRIDAAKEAILHRVATAAGVALPKGDTLPERMRSLIHVIETVTEAEPMEATPYDRELRKQQRERARPLLRDLHRLANYIALYDGYVREKPSAERMADTLQRLERESFGKAILSGARRCHVRIGEPADLGERWEAYQQNRRAEVARATRDVEGRVGELLRTMP
jgi:1-acyl-sn-glycerol-3-phosphate acyltransferase